ncbi:unnamed protein product [Lampetra fluviatilis]
MRNDSGCRRRTSQLALRATSHRPHRSPAQEEKRHLSGSGANCGHRDKTTTTAYTDAMPRPGGQRSPE